MKKILVMISLLLTAAASSQIHLGAKAGANLNKINGTSFTDKFELGYQLGGFVYADLSQRIGLQGEVLFNQTNTSIETGYFEVFNGAFKGNQTLNYISVPLLLRFNNNGIITFVAGPQFGFLTDADKSVTENGKKLFKKTDFSALGGVEVNFHPITIYGRYSWGFPDISDFGGKTTSQQIQLGLALRLF